MTALPSRFLGAWERRDLTVDDEVVADAGRAVWVEAGAAFVDVRGAGGFASDTCFAGATTWCDPHLSWRHTIDRDASAVGDDADVGYITFDGDTLIEEGAHIAGTAAAYRERWVRLPGSDAPVTSATTEGGLAVRVGDHAAAVLDRRDAGGGFAAAYARFDGERWVTELEVGDSDVELPRPLVQGGVLPTGWEWLA